MTREERDRARSEAVWPQERVAVLAQLVTDGLTFTEIGRRMGISKNAAIGKARRLGLNSPNGAGPRDEQQTLHQRLDALDTFPGFGKCAYPIGHPGRDGFHFCGAKNIAGKPYCSEHAALTYQRVNPDAARAA